MYHRLALRFASTVCLASLAACSGPQSDSAFAPADCTIAIETAFPGALPLEVESMVTMPIEQAVNGLPGVESIDSTSRAGKSVVALHIAAGHDLDTAMAPVAKAIGGVAAHLPASAEPSTISSIAPDALPGIWMTLAAVESAEIELFDVARGARDGIERFPHVDDVRIYGGGRQEIHVRCDPNVLVARGLSFDVFLKAIQKQAKQQLTVERLADAVVVTRDAVPIYVRDVAHVQIGKAPADRLAWLDGRPVVALGVLVRGQANAGQALEEIRSQLPAMRDALPDGATLSLIGGTKSAPQDGLLVELFVPPGTGRDGLQELVTQSTAHLQRQSATKVLSLWSRDDERKVQMLIQAKEGAKADAIVAAGKLEIPGVRVRTAPRPRLPAAWRPQLDVVLTLLGPDRKQLAEWSSAVASRLSQAGFREVLDEAPAAVADVSVQLKREKVAEAGVAPDLVAQIVAAGTHGIAIPIEANGNSAVRIFIGSEQNELDSLPVPAGKAVLPLSAIAEVTRVDVVGNLPRRNLQPVVRVTAALPAGGDLSARDDARRLAEAVRKELQLSAEYRIEPK